MSDSATSTQGSITPALCAGNFQAVVNQQPMNVTSLIARLTLRPELAEAPSHWVWKVIAEGKVGQKRTSIGLFFDRDLPIGTHNLVANDQIKVVYNENPHWQSVIYHSAHWQTGQLTLIEVDASRQRIKGQFSFGMSAIDFEVSEGAFDLQCQ
ncbi:hypothetical protein [Pseudomonas sp. DWP3-1-2]|uniref:hypothetical protein n=1 Tax=Pseudomonas sp. DWP3-1-2 TaxID=2804645 RepID=UPI003CF853B4